MQNIAAGFSGKWRSFGDRNRKSEMEREKERKQSDPNLSILQNRNGKGLCEILHVSQKDPKRWGYSFLSVHRRLDFVCQIPLGRSLSVQDRVLTYDHG